jgi:hypothetical protein
LPKIRIRADFGHGVFVLQKLQQQKNTGIHAGG